MTRWRLSLAGAATLVAANIGIGLCSAALAAFAHMLLVGAMAVVAAAALYGGHHIILAGRDSDGGSS